VKEFEFTQRVDNEKPVWLGHLRGDFCKVLGARHSDRDRESEFRSDPAPDRLRDFGRRTEEMFCPHDVGKGLVDGDALDEGREVRPGSIAASPSR
jgi:hypothetical protein